MRFPLPIVAVLLALPPAVIAATPAQIVPVPAVRQLRGLTADEATGLLATLEQAQQRLKAGQFQRFQLLAGSIASYDMTNSSPRDVFLRVPFQKVWDIQRLPNEDRPTYALAYAPNGLGQLYWEIEVAMSADGDLESVRMTYKPPAPF